MDFLLQGMQANDAAMTELAESFDSLLTSIIAPFEEARTQDPDYGYNDIPDELEARVSKLCSYASQVFIRSRI